MTSETPLETTITDAAATPSSTSVDGTTVANRSIGELIEADRHLAGAATLSKPRFGMLVRKIRRGSALG